MQPLTPELVRDVNDYIGTLEPGEALGAAMCMVHSLRQLAEVAGPALFAGTAGFHLWLIELLHERADTDPQSPSHNQCRPLMAFLMRRSVADLADRLAEGDHP